MSRKGFWTLVALAVIVVTIIWPTAKEKINKLQFTQKHFQPELTSVFVLPAPKPTHPPRLIPTKKILVVAPAPTSYTVVAGDNLWDLQTKLGRTVAQLGGFNHLANWNLITVGEVLQIPPVTYVAPAPPAPVYVAPAPVETVQAVSVASTDPVTPGSAFEACVIERESGGNAQVMNSSGHYGLYQFSEGTWVSNGGNPADFGNASPAEQQTVFDTAYARDGASPWQPYDGC